MSRALHASPEELRAKGQFGRERVQQLHDATHNAQLIVDAISG
jgi:hypothetical protein